MPPFGVNTGELSKSEEMVHSVFLILPDVLEVDNIYIKPPVVFG